MNSHRGQALLLVSVVLGLIVLTGAVLTLVGQGNSIKSLISQHHQDQVSLNEEAAAHSRNASINRAVNVESWCDGLNAINSYDRLIVRKAAHGAIVYTLPNLPCERIIRETLRSATVKTVIAEQTHPLVFKAMKHTSP